MFGVKLPKSSSGMVFVKEKYPSLVSSLIKSKRPLRFLGDLLQVPRCLGCFHLVNFVSGCKRN